MKLLNAKCMTGPASFTHNLPLPAHPGRISYSPGAMANLGSQGALKVQVIQHKLALKLVSSQMCIPLLLITGTHPYFSLHFCLWDLTFAALLGACLPTLAYFLEM